MNELASRYGLALYELAKETNQASSIYTQLLVIKEVFHDKEIMRFFKAEDVDLKEKLKALENSINQEHSKEVLGLLKLLIKNKRIGYLDQVIESFREYFYEDENIKIASVRTPIELTQQEKESLQSALSKKYDAQIEIKEVIDDSLVEGLVIRVDNDVFDNSLKSKLEQLKNSLTSGGNNRGY